MNNIKDNMDSKTQKKTDSNATDTHLQGKKIKRMRKRNREFMRVTWIFISMFLILCTYLVYFNVFKAEEINTNTYNTKQNDRKSDIQRGQILAADGEILAATTVDAEGKETRVYPYGQVFSHVVGYYENGKSGLEAKCDYDLTDSHISFLEQLEYTAEGQKVLGDNVYLTLDTDLQQAAYNALGAYRGAVVVMEASTGKILAMVSKPDFDPGTISENWEFLTTDDAGSPLLNRATQGLYPPGSTFKILTTLAFMRQNPDYQNYTYECGGFITKEDVTVTCYNSEVHGWEDLKSSFAHSCNSSYCNIGLELDNQEFIDLCNDFGFNNSLPLNYMEYSKSQFNLKADSSYGEQMTTAIGQGDTLVSPLHMAMITQSIANGGVMMTPYLIDHIQTSKGDLVKETTPTAYKTVMSAQEAGVLTEYMRETVLSGTATTLYNETYSCAGKTGSAEYDNGTQQGTHSWFVGFTDVDNPELVISVLIEDGGTGSSAAVPVTKQILDSYYYNYDNSYGY
ncbi:MAG: penicillin-binding transpeptidase domain-containing protein [Eubacteriales bacterium]|nr:penicillin-binding transpeptidase domain-containing protein [Eubacteriales bacterium]